MKIPNMGYHCSLIVEGVHDRENELCRQIGVANLGLVERQLGEMLRHVQSSPEWTDTGDLQHRLRFHFDPIRHALTFIASYLDGTCATEEDRLTARIFAMYVYAEVPKLVKDFGCEETVIY